MAEKWPRKLAQEDRDGWPRKLRKLAQEDRDEDGGENWHKKIVVMDG